MNTYFMGLQPLEMFLLLKCGHRLQTSESDVYRRQILTSKVDPRAVRAIHWHQQLCDFDLLCFHRAG